MCYGLSLLKRSNEAVEILEKYFVAKQRLRYGEPMAQLIFPMKPVLIRAFIAFSYLSLKNTFPITSISSSTIGPQRISDTFEMCFSTSYGERRWKQLRLAGLVLWFCARSCGTFALSERATSTSVDERARIEAVMTSAVR